MFYIKLFLSLCKTLCLFLPDVFVFVGTESEHAASRPNKVFISCFYPHAFSFFLSLLHTCFSSAGFYNAWFPEVLQPLSAPRVPAAMVVGSILVPTTDE